ncbi:MAG: hydroxymethylglutaryl-CoA reductase, degradative [Lactococcus cremoris]|jgi:hydroxymethylglutaryl-CoA reductase|uniref:3-hydroxy-3-methylglutaryl coenzyme A reductase n=1 Tax=Lactococcus cremoris subsp. cremoris IBB477 TaxID=1449093 RepID=A0A1E7G4F2_LACLC|nr:hydroxymethylglutaryl-CoA reductase, degradative [Lactococcus cremoris]MCI1840654.1 hydroxymethylglutaryl-CoA reductase, degradative [Lactococcus lactis]KZK10818.1 Hydroxymethylglutaryl-CoA reductase [Lactococcus cremoris]MCT0455035.1 hydroxymethylglutaryl-CoA reductase, degradative [Lactococcus cremoris]MCT0474251.1 hydroxymethylglutaryl-CoA reductase, degradative [Lactococcus cremoris]MCT0476828.1 hydroxymethylglutaryl-CoA reductase, degradative [Lactococcus cremoris]
MRKKFYQMSPQERLNSLNLSEKNQEILSEMALDTNILDNLIENQISEFELPMGIAQNFVINGQSFLIPMVTEEPSVIAAASNGAKISGNFVAEIKERLMRGQIVFYDVKNSDKIVAKILEKQEKIFEQAELFYPSIVKRGGGLREVSSRIFSSQKFLSVDVKVDVKDAMGANIINSILEGIAELFGNWFPDEKILFSILSNYATESLVKVTCEIPVERLSKKADGYEIGQKIMAASQYSKIDPYRASTHNKGIMNGINAVILATGNDTRAISAAIHAYAAKDGAYQGLANWELQEKMLVGELEIPLPVATVGGGVKVLPKAQAAMEILDISDAKELAKVIAAVGLAQNLAALRALVSEGIQQGHMSLQARSLALSVGAQADEIAILSQQLRKEKVMNQEVAQNLLKNLRK